ncbi:MAG TPA: M90 family metallopeptidase [Caldimonas sp.]|nr:M90 family metallopeptidase [Caldimonas sp.]
MPAWIQRWRQQRTLRRRPIPEPSWQLTLARFPFLTRRSEGDLLELRNMATLFLAQKEFAGMRGLEVTDEMAVAIAAQACLPALKLGLDWLDGFVGVVVHEDAVVARREVEDEDGIVHAFDEELAGEAMQGGPVMLAWRDVDEAGESAAEGYNVVVHEFAHVIDMRGGLTAGLDDVDPQSRRGIWLGSLADEFERFARQVDRNRPTFLDPYAAESLEEFFAVAAEAFFVAPLDLARHQKRVYPLLRDAFRQDPAATWRPDATA